MQDMGRKTQGWDQISSSPERGAALEVTQSTGTAAGVEIRKETDNPEEIKEQTILGWSR